MCGILGVAGANLPDRRTFTACLNLLQHRGPDFSAVSVFERGMFGHQRLTIIDLSDASNQPFETERAVLIFNGEIYNYRALREEVRQAGLTFTTAGDTEVIARAYERFGTAAFGRLRGMFALALYDKQSKELHLARDPFGIKPLYLRRGDRSLAFASELKPLLAIEPAAVNGPVLEETCVWGFPLSQASFYAGIEQVPPGSVLTFRDGAEVGRAIPASAHEGARTEDRLESVLRGSVADHMVADVPVAIALSGGLDSSVIAALAARQSDDLVAFTTTFSAGADEEVEHARIVAKHCGLRHEVVTLKVPDFEETLREVSYHLEEPIANPNIFPTFGLSRVIHDAGFKVVLMGEGSDELFAGYPWHRAALRFTATNGSMYRAYRKRRGGSDFLSYMRADAGRRVKAREAEFRRTFSRAAGAGSRLNRMLAFERAFQLQFSQLLRVDKMMMAHSVEARVPYLYPDVLHVAEALPASRRIRAGGTEKGRDNKIALADVARGLLPASIADRPKFGAGGTVNLWDTPLMQGFTQTASALVNSSGYCDAREILSPWIDWTAVGGLPKKQLFTLCQLIMTCHVHIVRGAAEYSHAEPAQRAEKRDRVAASPTSLSQGAAD